MINVFGHTNPDSDAICTAVVTAHWLTERGQAARAGRLGEVSRETRFIFEQAGVKVPPLLSVSLHNEPVWLVDFTEPAQGPVGLLQSNIVGIIDHHRLGGLITRLPPEVYIRPVGSSATVLWLLMSPEERRTLAPTLALLLLGAVLSDTVNLRSPVATENDVRTATELSVLSGVNRRIFARELLLAKTDVSGLSAQQLLDRDLKAFVISGTDVRIAQIEVSSTDQVSALLDDLLGALKYLADQSGTGLAVLMLTDIHAGFSTLYFAGRESVNAASCSIPGMLSRKNSFCHGLRPSLTPQEYIMTSYNHALILVSDKEDGTLLLNRAVALARPLGMKITLAHISDDYREMDYISDSLMDDAVSKEVVQAKAFMSELAASVPDEVDTRELVTMRRFEELEKCIADLAVDLVIAGHRNRFMGSLMSRASEYINHLAVDVLITHFND